MVHNSHSLIRQQDWHKDVSATLFTPAFPNVFNQSISTEKWLFLVQETTAGNADLSNCLNFGSMATSTRKGKMCMCGFFVWFFLGAGGVLLRHLIPFMAKADSWLDQVPPSSLISFPERRLLSNTVKQYPLSLQKTATTLAAISIL